MSEFDHLAEEAGREAESHPQDVAKGLQEAEKDIGKEEGGQGGSGPGPAAQ